VSAVFLRSYLDTAGSASFVPRDDDALRALLDSFVIEKAVYELEYELGHRPSWVGIPLDGLSEYVEEP
jgi:maltose alpha-D-glucosyltransferase/alpha-amylase